MRKSERDALLKMHPEEERKGADEELGGGVW